MKKFEINSIARRGRILPAVITVALLAAVTAGTFYLVFLSGPGGTETRLEEAVEAGVQNGEFEEAPAGAAALASAGTATGTATGVFMTVMEPQVEHWKDDKVQWKVKAREVKSHTGTGMTEFRDARGEYFRGKRLALTFRSPHATFDERERRAVAAGGVEGRFVQEGYSVRAGRLEWAEKDDTLNLEGGVGLDFGGGNRVRAGRVEVTDEMKKFRLTKGVEIELVVK